MIPLLIIQASKPAHQAAVTQPIPDFAKLGRITVGQTSLSTFDKLFPHAYKGADDYRLVVERSLTLNSASSNGLTEYIVVSWWMGTLAEAGKAHHLNFGRFGQLTLHEPEAKVAADFRDFKFKAYKQDGLISELTSEYVTGDVKRHGHFVKRQFQFYLSFVDGGLDEIGISCDPPS